MFKRFGALGAIVIALGLVVPALASAALSFAPAQTRLASPGEQVQGIVAADANGDGRPDAIVSSYDVFAVEPPRVSVLLGHANGTLGPAVSNDMIGSGPVTGIASGDFNGDGSPDVVFAEPFNETVGVSLNGGEGSFQAPTTWQGGGGPEALVTADFNGDKHVDVATVDSGEDAYTVMLGKGDGTFQPSVTTPIGNWTMGIATGDFNADGVPDLALTSNHEEAVLILIGTGTGSFGLAATVDLHHLVTSECECAEPWGIAAGDLNGDGRDDLVATDRFNDRLFTVLSQAGGTFLPLGPFASGEGNPIRVALGDLNGDGNLDAVTADYLEEQATVMLGAGDGTLVNVAELPAGPSPDDVAIADVDGDGRPDLLFAGQDTDGFLGGTATVIRNTSLAAALAAPTSLSFGGQALQTVSGPRTITVSNGGAALLRVSGAVLEGPDAGDFIVSPNACTAAPILAGSSCAIAVRFAPGAVGGHDASLRVLTDAPSQPAAVSLTGTGTVPPAGPPSPARLFLSFAQRQLRASAGKPIQVKFVATLPGRATIKVTPGRRVIRRTLKSAGPGSFRVKLAKPGRYQLQLEFRSTDGQKRSVNAKLVVSGG